MIADHRERNLTVCQEIKDGSWSDWKDLGDCEGLQEVEGVANYSCGLGLKPRERNCARTLGGKFCQLDGEDYKGTVMRNSKMCHSGDCPG